MQPRHAIAVLASFLCLLTGCAGSLPHDPSKMTPEQLKAVKEASTTAQCTTAAGPWGRGQTTFITIDRSSINSGTVSVDDACKITVTADPKAAK